jgi:hypothetical protein
MPIELQPDETILKDIRANHFKGIESVGGRLYATNQRVVFKSHILNVQNHILSIPYSDIKSFGTRNTLGIIPNGLYIELHNGTIEKFVVPRRNEWIELLQTRI